MKLGDDVKPKQLQKRIDAQKPGHVCTLIYTSGTTGNPKAVMITHDNATWTPQTVFCALGDDFGTVEELNVSYLPLSHVAAQMLDIHMPIAVCATRGGKCSVTFARPDALKGTLKDTLVATRPTLLFGVPRVWEKMGDAIKAIGAKNTGIKAMLGKWAKGKAEAMYLNKQIGHSGSEVNERRRCSSPYSPHPLRFIAVYGWHGGQVAGQSEAGARPRSLPLHDDWRGAHQPRHAALLWLAQHAHLRAVRHVGEHRPAHALVSRLLFIGILRVRVLFAPVDRLCVLLALG